MSDKRLDSLRKTKYNSSHVLTRKKIKQNKKDRLRFLAEDIRQFHTVFTEYKLRHGFNFDTADSLFIFYQFNLESGLKDFIIISGVDTISYGEGWKQITLHQFQKEIIYKHFLSTAQTSGGYVNTRDTLLALATKHDFVTARQLEQKYPILDGESSTLLLINKRFAKYFFEEYSFQPFGFVPKGNSNIN